MSANKFESLSDEKYPWFKKEHYVKTYVKTLNQYLKDLQDVYNLYKSLTSKILNDPNNQTTIDQIFNESKENIEYELCKAKK